VHWLCLCVYLYMSSSSIIGDNCVLAMCMCLCACLSFPGIAGETLVGLCIGYVWWWVSV